MLTFVVAVVSALIFSFLCSISEAALLSIRHADVQRLGNSRPGKILSRFKREIDVPIAAVLLLNTVANTTGASIAGAAYPEVFEPETLWIFTTCFTIAVLLFTEILPKTLGVVYASQLSIAVAYFVQMLIWVFKPLLLLVRVLSAPLRGLQKDAPATSIEEIRLLASLGSSQGLFGTAFADIIDGAAALRNLRARDIMIPRTEISYLSGKLSVEDNVKRIRRSGYSRMPYSESGSIDEISGVVVSKDVICHLYDGATQIEWSRFASRAVVVPESASVDRLLKVFQRRARQMAIVVDEYGGVSGLVTLEDVLEEIVGDIRDESDEEERSLLRQADGSYHCAGSTETRHLLELLDIDEEAVSATLTGWIADVIGRIPQTGDIVRSYGLQLTVMEASPRRAELVEVRRISSEPPESQN